MGVAFESGDAASQYTGPVLESERLLALLRLGLSDTPASAGLDGIARLAQAALQVPILCIALVDQERVWFKSRVGLTLRETPRRGSFCEEVVSSRRLLVVRDAAQEPRFAGHPLVADSPRIRSYLGIPLFTRDRHAIGTLCAMDPALREFGEAGVVVLGEFAKIAEDLLSIKESAAKSDGVLQYALEREKLFRGTFEQAPVGIVHTSLHGLILRTNQRACNVLGYSAAELRELSIPSITHPEDLPVNLREFKRILAGDIDSYRLEQRLLCKDQRYVWTALTVGIKRLLSRQPDYSIVMIEDIAAQKESNATEHSLRQRESEAVRQVDAARFEALGEELRATRAAAAEAHTVSRDTQTVLGETRTKLGESQTALAEAQTRLRDQQTALAETRTALAEAQTRLRDQQTALDATQTASRETQTELREMQLAFHETQSALRETQMRLADTQTALSEVREELRGAQELYHEGQAALHAAHAKLAHESAIDQLTVLANRRTFAKRGEQAASALRQSRKAFGLILLDLDDLKRVNEEYGHEMGDGVLHCLGAIMSMQLRNSSDMAARLGGDEFAILCLGDINEQTLHDVAGRIQSQMAKEPLATAKGLLRYTGSFGLALGNAEDADWKTVYARADAALREAKAAGKDRISFGRSPPKSAAARLRASSAAAKQA